MHAGNFFCDSWPRPLTFYPKVNEFPGLILEHFCVKFGDPSCVGFWDIVREKTDTQTNVGKNLTLRRGVGNRLIAPSVRVCRYIGQERTKQPSNVRCQEARWSYSYFTAERQTSVLGRDGGLPYGLLLFTECQCMRRSCDRLAVVQGPQNKTYYWPDYT